MSSIRAKEITKKIQYDNRKPVVVDHDIFPVRYYQVSMPGNDDLKELFVDKIVEDSKELITPKGWLTDKLRTSFDGEPKGKEIFFGEDDTLQNVLTAKYSKLIGGVFDARYRIKIDEIWYNVYMNGEWQEEHHHIGGGLCNPHFSCIHFLSFDKTRHERVAFSDPLDPLRCLSLELDRNDYSDRHYPNINEGDLLMFPSYLKHFVKKGIPTPDYPRITIAFNFEVLEYAGGGYD